MSENDNTQPAPIVNPEPVLILGAVYSRSQLDVKFGDNPRRFARWKEAGLEALDMGTNEEYFLSDDLIAVWKKKPKRKEKPK